jgi:hypothetical protein
MGSFEQASNNKTKKETDSSKNSNPNSKTIIHSIK